MIVYYKATFACNLGCSYCIVKNMEAISRPSPEESINHLKTYPIGSHIIFHGGEPTLIGPEFYEKVINGLDGRNYSYSIQTNLQIRDIDKWIRVFKKLDYISTSDDFINTEREGMDAEMLWRNIRYLLANGIQVQVIITLHKSNLNALEVIEDRLRLLREEERARVSLRVNYVKPYMDRARDILLEKGEYADFVIKLDRMLKQKFAEVEFSTIEDYRKALQRDGTNPCMLTSLCFNRYVADASGERYVCSGLEELKVKHYPADRIYRLYSGECAGCEFFHSCQGGCIIDGLVRDGSAYRKTIMCEDNKKIFKYLLEGV